ncbi:uncharacterized protein Z518_02483 [Rhinocladiella mackenziei CBS 650.93]|uniref:Xylanolytic transcriptional activator regulatory domain-containing protein n=1 Tax=Rhinocladiella mackenziei CBS 650.93 TaxID=1442369 RepID=A0A0D2IPL0_9EURO|nr:uncharacterized protein Z518_02483 [Rhinocladiella mackenziei CBS 650.93]KIX07829.1 hypothetical protein Z518_02483 [Rhinocladiella mackenziei CBS 650.93]
MTIPIAEYVNGSTDNVQREMLYFPALLFQVLAQILQALSPQHAAAETLGISNYADCDRLSQSFYLIGNKLVSMLGRHHPTLCSIEHDLVSSCWLKNSGRGSEAWYRLGSAVRQAQELGLHSLPQSIEQTPEDSLESNLLKIWALEHRKRIWARLFVVDSILALALGRPRLLHREDCSTPAPLNCEYPKDPARTVPLSLDDSPFTTTLPFLTLANKIHDMLSFVANGIFTRDYTKVLSVHQDVYSLRKKLPLSLPGNFPGPCPDPRTARLTVIRLSILNSINVILVALHRPFLRTQPSSRTAAVNAALEGLELQNSICDLIPYPQSKAYGTVFYTIDASVFLCGIMIEMPPTDPAEDRRIRQALLESIEAGEQILRHFCQKIQVARRSSWEPVDCFQQADQQPEGLERDSLGNISIPPPQQHPYETYQSLFGEGQSSYEHLDPIQDQSLGLEDPSSGDIGNFSPSLQVLSQNGYLWSPEYNFS